MEERNQGFVENFPQIPFYPLSIPPSSLEQRMKTEFRRYFHDGRFVKMNFRIDRIKSIDSPHKTFFYQFSDFAESI